MCPGTIIFPGFTAYWLGVSKPPGLSLLSLTNPIGIPFSHTGMPHREKTLSISKKKENLTFLPIVPIFLGNWIGLYSTVVRIGTPPSPHTQPSACTVLYIPPPLWYRGWGLCMGDGVRGSQFGRGDRHCGTLCTLCLYVSRIHKYGIFSRTVPGTNIVYGYVLYVCFVE